MIAYIENEWLNEDTQQRFHHCSTDIYLHFDMRATSREGSNWMPKRDLGTSMADLLTVIRSFERPATHQHELFKKALDQKRINKPTSMLKSPLVGNVRTPMGKVHESQSLKPRRYQLGQKTTIVDC
jgi:hypothetical protein